MFDPNEIPHIRRSINGAMLRDRRLLDDLRSEVKVLSTEVRTISPRSTTSVSLVASDGGNNELIFDPFHIQLVRVVDCYGEQLCLDSITPLTDTDVLSSEQFNADGSPKTALGRLMADLGVDPPMLSQLSHMIPEGKKIRDRPAQVSPSWVGVYRDICEWAALFEKICHRTFATDTLVVRDGLLRSVLFRKDYFVRFREKIEKAIKHIFEKTRRRIFLVGMAKQSKVLTKYNLAMAIEGILKPGAARYVRVPREFEAKTYVWPEYAYGLEHKVADSNAPEYVAGNMYFVRFGERSGDPIWTVDLLTSQASSDSEIFGYLLADAINGFPVPFYPRCLQRAHELAQIKDFDLEILQEEIVGAISSLLDETEVCALEELRIKDAYSKRGQ